MAKENKYSKANHHGFPSHMVPPKKKNKEWHLLYVKAFHREFTQGTGKILRYAYEDYERWRLYARAKQPIDQYKDMLGIKSRGGKRDASWRNLDYNVLAIFPKFRKIIKNKILNTPKKITISAIDPESINKERRRKIDIQEYIVNQEFLKSIEDQIGTRFESPIEDGAPMPRNDQEIDLYMRMNPKNRYIMELQDELDLYFENNNWEQISNELVEDLIEVGIGATRTYIDSNGFIKTRRIIPERMITNLTIHNDFSDIIRVGEYIEMTISDLRQRVPKGTFSEDDYAKMANRVSGTRYSVVTNDTYFERHQRYPYDHEKITVLDAEWFSNDEMAHVIGETSHGNEFVKEMDNPYWLNKKGFTDDEYKQYYEAQGERREIVRTNIKNVYGALWVVDTDYIFEYGLRTNMMRAQSSLTDTRLSYSLYSLEFDSIMRELEPILDNIQLNWLQFQHHIAQSKPDGIAIERKALGSVQIGGKGGEILTPQDILRMYSETGSYIYKGTDQTGKPYPFKPIEELKNGLSDAAIQHFDIIIKEIELIRNIIGINEVEDASMPNSDVLKGVAEIAAMGTNNALGDFYHAYGSIYENTAKAMALLIPDAKRIGNQIGMIEALGEESNAFWSSVDDIRYIELGIKIKDGTDTYKRERINQYVQQSLKANGGFLLPEDALLIENEENLERAYLMLVQKRKEREAEDEERQSRLYKMEEEKNINSSQASEQAKQETIQREHAMEIEKEREFSTLRQKEIVTKAQMDIIVNKSKAGTDLDEKEMEIYGRILEAQVKGEYTLKASKQKKGE